MALATGTPVGSGLSSAEAARRLASAGPNVLPEPRHPTLAGRILRQLAEPLSLLLLAAATVSLAVLHETKEGIAILVIAVVDAVVGAVQEHRADRAVAALRQLTAPTARVRRDGRTTRVDAATLVPGDIVELAAGDRVPADLRLVETASFAVDEASLTGESLPVEKEAGALATGTSPSDRPDTAFAGTSAVRGRGAGEVVSTGAGTELGRLASSLAAPPAAPLELELKRLGRVLAVVAVLVGTLLVPVAAVRSSEEDPLAHALLAGVALAVAAIPEGLPAAVTAALALGAQRMARKGAIVRRLAAIEALGSTGVLCVDKTGTLTTGRLSVQADEPVAGREDALWAALLRCNDATQGGEDPMDVAIAEAAAARGVPAPPGRRVAEQPFDAATRLMATVHEAPDGRVLSVKGAPEAVLPRCRPGPDRDALDATAAALAAQGLRVLAVADSTTGDPGSRDWRPLGVVALADTVRPSAPAAAAACRRAGIRIVMVTGDHQDTASHVAAEVGLDPRPVVTGSQLAALDADRRAEALAEAAVVARVDPSVKVDLVGAHRRLGRVVAMTGDGVNDAPALQQADVGVAVAGDAGTDVARQAADLVVTNGDLGTIVAAVREGRRIYRNLTNVVAYLVAGNLSEILIVAAGVVLLPELTVPLLPVQLLWVNLMTDGLPALALGVDKPPGDPLEAPPRDPRRTLLSPRGLGRLAGRAGVMATAALGTALLARLWDWSPEQQRTQLVTSLVLVHLVLAYITRAERFTFGPGWWHSRAVAVAVGGSMTLEVLVTVLAPARSWLGLAALPARGWLLAAGAVVATVALVDAGRGMAARAQDRRAAGPSDRGPVGRATRDERP